MALRLHWSPDSANLPVRLALEELGFDYETVRVHRAARDHKTPAYRALNPQGLLPVLEDDDVVLFETAAILLYLADKAGRLGSDGPRSDDPAARATFLRWLFWISNTPHADLRAAFYAHRYIAQDLVPDLRAGLSKRFVKHIEMVNGAMASGHWPAAEPPMLVDLYLGCCIRWVQIYPGAAPLLPDGPDGALRERLGALQALPTVRRAAGAESITTPLFIGPSPPDLPRTEVTG